MPVSTIFLALTLGASLVATPAGGPSRLDPDDIEALEALLRAMTGEAPEEAGPDTPEPGSGEDQDEETVPEAPEPQPAPAAAQPAPAASADPAPPAPSVAVRTAPPASRAVAPFGRMGPHTGFERYAEARGSALGNGRSLTWRVVVGDMGDDGAPPADSAPADGTPVRNRTFFAGNGWAGETGANATTLFDLAAERILTLDAGSGTYTNTSLFAAVRRNVDIYTALSRAGQAEEIAFGPSTRFHRFWLEAAMGVAAAPAGLTRSARPAERGGGQVTSWYRAGQTVPVASAWTGCEAADRDPARLRSLVTVLGHRVPLHPDILGALRDGEPLCGFSFAVISPDSPDGRTELWQLTDHAPFNPATLGFQQAQLLAGESGVIAQEVQDAILAVLAGELGAPPSPPDFLVEIQALSERGDYAGAMLTLAQETAHFGLCPAETIGSERLACAGAFTLAEAGAGDPGFQAVMEATEAAADGAHRLAVERLSPFLERTDRAGSAARTLAARQLVEWGEGGAAAHPDLDPPALLAEALVIDPFAAAIYWHLAQRYMAAGAPEEAWFFLDAGRALPGRDEADLTAQASNLENRLRQLAPALVFPTAAQ